MCRSLYIYIYIYILRLQNPLLISLRNFVRVHEVLLSAGRKLTGLRQLLVGNERRRLPLSLCDTFRSAWRTHRRRNRPRRSPAQPCYPQLPRNCALSRCTFCKPTQHTRTRLRNCAKRSSHTEKNAGRKRKNKEKRFGIDCALEFSYLNLCTLSRTDNSIWLLFLSLEKKKRCCRSEYLSLIFYQNSVRSVYLKKISVCLIYMKIQVLFSVSDARNVTCSDFTRSTNFVWNLSLPEETRSAWQVN